MRGELKGAGSAAPPKGVPVRWGGLVSNVITAYSVKNTRHEPKGWQSPGTRRRRCFLPAYYGKGEAKKQISDNDDSTHFSGTLLNWELG